MLNMRSFGPMVLLSVATVLGVVTLDQSLSLAFQRSDGTVVFEAPPRVVAASTTRQSTTTRNAIFYFTLNLPENAGEPLGQVIITPITGAHWMWPYNLERTTAFEGDRYNRGQALAIAGAVQDPDTLAVTVTFANPVPPGQVLTLALSPRRTPDSGGSYDFKVTAFPAGTQPEAQYAGVVRLNFYESDSDNPVF